jgi:Protein of unknown function (DUF3467)
VGQIVGFSFSVFILMWGRILTAPFFLTMEIRVLSPTFGTQNSSMEQQPNNQLNIEISEEVAEGAYANLAIITHSNAEFVIDFVNVMPGTPKSKVKSRIIFTPMHAKRFMKALEENIARFEEANGSIQDLEQIEIPMHFGGPTAQA